MKNKYLTDKEFIEKIKAEYSDELYYFLSFENDGNQWDRFFQDKIDVKKFEKLKKKNSNNDTYYLNYYTEKENGIISRIHITEDEFIHKEEYILFHRDFIYSIYDLEGRLLEKYSVFDNVDRIHFGKSLSFDDIGNIVVEKDYDLPFSLYLVANYFWEKLSIDFWRDCPFIEENQQYWINLTTFIDDTKAIFWIISYTNKENINLPYILKIDGVTGQEVFHRPMLPEDEAMYFPKPALPTKKQK